MLSARHSPLSGQGLPLGQLHDFFRAGRVVEIFALCDFMIDSMLAMQL